MEHSKRGGDSTVQLDGSQQSDGFYVYLVTAWMSFAEDLEAGIITTNG